MSEVFNLAEMSTHQLHAALTTEATTVALLPLGSTEPHGPHLPLRTDVTLAEENARRAASLFPANFRVFIVPSLPFGVTDFAAGFRGAIGLTATTFECVVRELVSALLDDGFNHVSLINHHLDPNHLKALDRAINQLRETYGPHRVSHPSVLEGRWGRQLGAEFRSGACHAGEYESSMVLAAEPELFQRQEADALEKLDLSLSDGIRRGVKTFRELGMTDAYTGDPGKATAEFGHELYSVMCDMVVTTVCEQLRRNHEN